MATSTLVQSWLVDYIDRLRWDSHRETFHAMYSDFRRCCRDKHVSFVPSFPFFLVKVKSVFTDTGALRSKSKCTPGQGFWCEPLRVWAETARQVATQPPITPDRTIRYPPSVNPNVRVNSQSTIGCEHAKQLVSDWFVDCLLRHSDMDQDAMLPRHLYGDFLGYCDEYRLEQRLCFQQFCLYLGGFLDKHQRDMQLDKINVHHMKIWALEQVMTREPEKKQ